MFWAPISILTLQTGGYGNVVPEAEPKLEQFQPTIFLDVGADTS